MKDSEIISLKNDLAFKRAFSNKNNIDMLQDLLSSILDIPFESIKDINIRNNELLPERKNEKYSILDINLMADDKLINIEMQVAQESFFADRTLYYWARLYTSELKSGDGYDKLQQAICINFLDFNMFECEKYHSIYELKERKNNDLLTDKCQIHFLELKKYKKQYPSSHLESWLQLINAKTENELEMAGKSDFPMIKKAVTVIMEMSADERLKEEMRVREKAMLDIISHEREKELLELKKKEMEEKIKVMNEKIKIMKEEEEVLKEEKEVLKEEKEVLKEEKEAMKEEKEAMKEEKEAMKEEMKKVMKDKEKLIKRNEEIAKKSEEILKQNEEIEKQKEQIKKKGIQDLISVCEDLGASVNDAILKLIEKCSLSEQEAKKCIEEYWGK